MALRGGAEGGAKGQPWGPQGESFQTRGQGLEKERRGDGWVAECGGVGDRLAVERGRNGSLVS